MKRTLLFPLLTFALFLLCACGMQKDPAPAEYHILVATDLHYISPALTDQGERFTELVDRSDGKLMRYIEELSNAFFAEVIQEKLDALLLTGDLSFNGAVKSHEDLAEKLAQVEAAGVPVLVLPGNHDLYNSSAALFSGESYTLVPSASADVFREIYADYGFEEALSTDKDSLSYLYPLNESSWILMLDANTRDNPCGFSKSSLRWIEQQLNLAKKSGVSILAACHQNLLQHSVFYGGYVLNQAQELQRLLEKYNVSLILSGHLHIQHIGEKNGVTEIVTSALSVYPCQYGILDAEDGEMRYHTRCVDVSSWAAAQGRTEPELLQFADYAREYMLTRSRRQAEQWLMDMDCGKRREKS